MDIAFHGECFGGSRLCWPADHDNFRAARRPSIPSAKAAIEAFKEYAICQDKPLFGLAL